MHSPRRIAPLTRALSVAGVLAICASTASIAVASSSKHHHHRKPVQKALQLGGTWTGQYSGAFSGTFTLKWTQSGSKLTGTIVLSFPSGSYSCDGSVNGSSITFGAVG